MPFTMDVSPEEQALLDSLKEKGYLFTRPESIAPPNTSILPLWEKWLVNEKKYSVKSMREYRGYVYGFCNSVKSISQGSVNYYMAKHPTVVCCASLKSLFNFLVLKQDYPEHILNIKFDKVRHSRPMPNVISEQDVLLIVEHIPEIPIKIMTILSFELALRVSEACLLQWNSFRWTEWLQDKTQWGKVELKKTKGNKFRVLPVKPQLMALLYDSHKQKDSNGLPVGRLMFPIGSSANPDARILSFLNEKEEIKGENLARYLEYACRTYRRALYKASMEAINRRVSPHVLRHSKAQNLLDSGMTLSAIQQLLGHASISTTQIYAQSSSEDVKRELQKVEDTRKNKPQGL